MYEIDYVKLEEARKLKNETEERLKKRNDLIALLYNNGASIESLAWFFGIRKQTVAFRLMEKDRIDKKEYSYVCYGHY